MYFGLQAVASASEQRLAFVLGAVLVAGGIWRVRKMWPMSAEQILAPPPRWVHSDKAWGWVVRSIIPTMVGLSSLFLAAGIESFTSDGVDDLVGTPLIVLFFVSVALSLETALTGRPAILVLPGLRSVPVVPEEPARKVKSRDERVAEFPRMHALLRGYTSRGRDSGSRSYLELADSAARVSPRSQTEELLGELDVYRAAPPSGRPHLNDLGCYYDDSVEPYAPDRWLELLSDRITENLTERGAVG